MTLRAAAPIWTNRGSVLETAPATEPVTATALQEHLRTDDTDLPDYAADALITEARQEIEDASGLALITQSWRLSLDAWPGSRDEWWDGVRQGSIAELHGNPGVLALPRYPLQSVTSVTVYDEDSNATAVTVGSTFDIDTYQRPGRIALQSGATWPVALRPTDAIQIVYVAGFGAAGDVPAPLVRAVKQLAAYLYAHRGDGCDVGEAFSASGAAGIVGRYRVVRL